MKKIMNKIWLLAAFALVGTAFVACGDDDDPPATPAATDYAQTAAGTYNGKIDVPALGQIPAQTIDSVSIAVTYVSKDSANLQMNQILPIVGQPIPLNVTCPVTASAGENGSIKLSGNTVVTLDPAITIPISPSPISQLPITINGTITGNNASIGITVLSMITVTFTGTK